MIFGGGMNVEKTLFLLCNIAGATKLTKLNKVVEFGSIAVLRRSGEIK